MHTLTAFIGLLFAGILIWVFVTNSTESIIALVVLATSLMLLRISLSRWTERDEFGEDDRSI